MNSPQKDTELGRRVYLLKEFQKEQEHANKIDQERWIEKLLKGSVEDDPGLVEKEKRES